jgi:hypothetical protein
MRGNATICCFKTCPNNAGFKMQNLNTDKYISISINDYTMNDPALLTWSAGTIKRAQANRSVFRRHVHEE